MIHFGVPSKGVSRGCLRRARRACGLAVALAGCVGVLPQPAPSADLSTIRLPPGFAIDYFARDLGHARFLTLDPRGTLLVSVPRAGRVGALPRRQRGWTGGRGRAGRGGTRASPRAGLPQRPALRRRDGARRALRLRSGHTPRPRRTDGHRARSPGARQSLDTEHRDRSRSEAPGLGGLVVQQLRGA